jgi:hypothetical protein
MSTDDYDYDAAGRLNSQDGTTRAGDDVIAEASTSANRTALRSGEAIRPVIRSSLSAWRRRGRSCAGWFWLP